MPRRTRLRRHGADGRELLRCIGLERATCQLMGKAATYKSALPVQSQGVRGGRFLMPKCHPGMTGTGISGGDKPLGPQQRPKNFEAYALDALFRSSCRTHRRFFEVP